MLWQWGWTTSGNQHQCVGPQGYNLMADLMGEDMVMAAMGNGWFWYDYLYGVKDRYTSSAFRSYDMWNYYYTLISNVNYIINAKDTMEGTEADVNYIIGNAYAIRAYCYAYLGMIFARSYIGHEDMLCVPVYTENTVSGTPGKARETNRKVFGQALDDINNAVNMLQGAARQHVSHFDQYSANGLKARIALYMGEYQTAHDAAVEASREALPTPSTPTTTSTALATPVSFGAQKSLQLRELPTPSSSPTWTLISAVMAMTPASAAQSGSTPG